MRFCLNFLGSKFRKEICTTGCSRHKPILIFYFVGFSVDRSTIGTGRETKKGNPRSEIAHNCLEPTFQIVGYLTIYLFKEEKMTHVRELTNMHGQWEDKITKDLNSQIILQPLWPILTVRQKYEYK